MLSEDQLPKFQLAPWGLDMTPSSFNWTVIEQAQEELNREYPDAVAGDMHEWNGVWWRYRTKPGVPSRGIPGGHVWEPVGSA